MPALDIQRLNAGEYRITWSGTDSISGIAGYDLDLQTDDGGWVSIRSNTLDTSWTLPAASGHTYRLRLTGRDRVGNAATLDNARSARPA